MSRYELKKTVVMVGMMGAGKTSVGMAVAQILGVPFLDSDHEIEQAANLSISEVFETFGEAVFREKEALVLKRLLEGPPCVLSTGGGAFMQATNRQSIQDAGVAVWLKVEPDLLWSRVKQKDTRPLLKVKDPRARLLELYEGRKDNYAQAAITVDAHRDFSVQDMAEQVVRQLVAHPDGIVRDLTVQEKQK